MPVDGKEIKRIRSVALQVSYLQTLLLQVTWWRAGDSTVSRQHDPADSGKKIMPVTGRRKRIKQWGNTRPNSRGNNHADRLDTGTSQISNAITMSGNVSLKLAGRRFISPGPAIGKKKILLDRAAIKQRKTKPQR